MGVQDQQFVKIPFNQ